MTLLEPTPAPENDDDTAPRLPLLHDRTIDLRGAPGGSDDTTISPGPGPASAEADPPHEPSADARSARRRNPFPALRLGRVRVLSLTKVATVFSVVGFLVSVGTTVVVWNMLLRFGLVDSAEDAVATGLGLDEFTIAGGDWFGVVVAGFAVLFAFVLLVTILLTLVYNATCSLFGGVAIEARPVRRLTLRQRFLHGVRRWREARA